MEENVNVFYKNIFINILYKIILCYASQNIIVLIFLFIETNILILYVYTNLLK